MKQKEEHLQRIIQTLETDYKDGVPMSAITIENISNPGNVFNMLSSATNDELIKDYGSATKYFESLSKSNVKAIRISPMKRNGICTTKYGSKITWKRSTKIDPLEVSFATDGNQEVAKEQKAVTTENHYPVAHGMNAGLSGSDYHKIYDHQRLQTENSELKAENKLQAKEITELKDKVLANEYLGQRSVEKGQTQVEFVKAGKEYVPIILEAIKSLRPQPVMQGMTGTVSPVKERFLKADDELLVELEQVGMRCESQEFLDELKALIEKYPLQNA